jgi:hypothetical protein
LVPRQIGRCARRSRRLRRAIPATRDDAIGEARPQEPGRAFCRSGSHKNETRNRRLTRIASSSKDKGDQGDSNDKCVSALQYRGWSVRWYRPRDCKAVRREGQRLSHRTREATDPRTFVGRAACVGLSSARRDESRQTLNGLNGGARGACEKDTSLRKPTEGPLGVFSGAFCFLVTARRFAFSFGDFHFG